MVSRVMTTNRGTAAGSERSLTVQQPFADPNTKVRRHATGRSTPCYGSEARLTILRFVRKYPSLPQANAVPSESVCMLSLPTPSLPLVPYARSTVTSKQENIPCGEHGPVWRGR